MSFYSRPQKVNTSTQEPDGPSGEWTRGKDPFANGAAPYGMSPYVNSRGEPIPWADASKTTPRFTPDAGMPQNQGYFFNDARQAPGGQWEQDQAAKNARSQAERTSMLADPKYAAAAASKDMGVRYRAARQYEHDQQTANPTHGNDYGEYLLGGGTSQGWDDRYKTAWPTPTMKDGTRGKGAPTTAGGPAGTASTQSASGGGGARAASGLGFIPSSTPPTAPVSSQISDQLQKEQAALHGDPNTTFDPQFMNALSGALGKAPDMTQSNNNGAAATQGRANQGWGLNSNNQQKQQFAQAGGTKEEYRAGMGQGGFGQADSTAAANRLGNQAGQGSAGQVAAQGGTDWARKNTQQSGGMGIMDRINANRKAAGLPPM